MRMTSSCKELPARVVAALAMAAGLALPAVPAHAEPGQHAPALAENELDPAPLQRLFAEHVQGGEVDYRALKDDAAARAGLARYLDSAESMSPRAPLASWLNVYNALVVEGVLAHYPIDSVKSVPGFFERAPRVVAGQKRSLDAIENQVIRPRFRDARVHMALNCGAVSCPPLAARPFRQATLDATLDALSRAAVENPRVVRLVDGVLHHSKLFEWFAEDFERDAGSVRGWIAHHAKDPRLRKLPASTPMKALDYDWALAEVK